LLLAMAGCSPLYKNLQPAIGTYAGLQRFKPVFKTALYNTTVDVTSNHLSGLLLVKTMPDSSIRMVFSNEMGYKFFDFEFTKNNDFKVYSIIKQMDKKAVIKTLRKNFELVLMRNMDSARAFIKTDSAGNKYYGFPQEKGFNYYVTNAAGTSLIRMERASKRKVVVQAIMKNYAAGIPDTIGISHKGFRFDIGLKKLERE